MNLQSEANKPIFVMRPTAITPDLNSRLNEALGKQMAVRSALSGDYMIKRAFARNLPKSVLIGVNQATQQEIRDLILARLKLDEAERFEFIDGTAFSGTQAAEEIKKDSRYGKYFLELEKQTLQISQKAFWEGRNQ